MFVDFTLYYFCNHVFTVQKYVYLRQNNVHVFMHHAVLSVSCKCTGQVYQCKYGCYLQISVVRLYGVLYYMYHAFFRISLYVSLLLHSLCLVFTCFIAITAATRSCLPFINLQICKVMFMFLFIKGKSNCNSEEAFSWGRVQIVGSC